MKPELQKKSKFLSKILRHDPHSVGISLSDKGWANVSDILKILKIKKDELFEIVETNNKQRFEFDQHQLLIRARQGHSIEVDVELQSFIPTQYLYHGTATRFLDSIMKNGLEKRSRNHVHLSDNIPTAQNVGSRHGTSIVLKIDAIEMQKDGFEFFKSNNGVYLTDNIPAKYITINS